jgi:predicted MFS family arabinose efflux permease
MLLTFSFTNVYGVYIAVGTIITYLLEPYEYDSSDAGIMLGAVVVFGVVGSFFFSILLDKTKKFVIIYRFMCLSILMLVLLLEFTIKKDNFVNLCIHLAFFGFFLIATLPVGFSFSVDLTYPVNETLSSGFLILFSTIIGTIYSYTATYILSVSRDRLEEDGPLAVKNTLTIMICMLVCAVIASFFVK